jgi:hypothetical protein
MASQLKVKSGKWKVVIPARQSNTKLGYGLRPESHHHNFFDIAL